MKYKNTLLLVLAAVMLVIASLACASTERSSSPKPISTTRTTSTCYSGDDFEAIAEVISGWNMHFTKGEFGNEWVVDKDPESIMSLSYEEDRNGCLSAVGSVTIIDWNTGSFEDAGVFHGLVAGVGTDAFGNWLFDLVEKGCINTAVSKTRPGSDGSNWYFECEDFGDFVGISSMYIFP